MPSIRAGASWTKIFSDGYSGGQWAVDKLISARGQHSVTIPSIKAGQYLLRAEILGLHEAEVLYANNNLRGAQFYPRFGGRFMVGGKC